MMRDRKRTTKGEARKKGHWFVTATRKRDGGLWGWYPLYFSV